MSTSDYEFKTLSSPELLGLGQRLYREKDFSKALDVFTAALRYAGEEKIYILNNRAATYEQFSRYPDAVRDARSMMDLDKSAAMGYLRAGKALQRMKKFAKARNIYEYGLQNVKTDDPDRQVLQDVLGRLLQLTVRIDPFTVLPSELVSMVMEHVPEHNRITCLRVSKPWNVFLSALTSLWKSVRFSCLSSRVSRRSLAAALRRCGGTLADFSVFGWVAPDDKDKLRQVLKSVTELRHLTVRMCAFDLDSIVTFPCHRSLTSLRLESRHGVSMPTLTTLLNACQSLERLVVGHYMDNNNSQAAALKPALKLKSLILATSPREKPSPLLYQLDDLLSHAPNIRTLRLVRLDLFAYPPPCIDLTSVTHLTELTIFDCLIHTFPRLPPTLEKLTIKRDVPSGDDVFWGGVGRPDLLQLRTLELGSYNALPEETLRNLLDSAKGKLQSFMLASRIKSEASPLARLAADGYLGEVTFLRLIGLQLDDDAIATVVKHAPLLASVDVSNLPITGIAVKHLVENLAETLKEVKISLCKGVSPDVVQYALVHGLKLDLESIDQRAGRAEREQKRVRRN